MFYRIIDFFAAIFKFILMCFETLETFIENRNNFSRLIIAITPSALLILLSVNVSLWFVAVAIIHAVLAIFIMNKNLKGYKRDISQPQYSMYSVTFSLIMTGMALSSIISFVILVIIIPPLILLIKS